MLGIFGGTFDPPHYGHLRAALEVKQILKLDEVRFVLSATPPHREQPTTTIQQRLRMLELAVGEHPDFVIDCREIDRPGKSYMVDSLASLRADFPDKPLLLFIGTDAFNKLNTWHRWENLFDYAHVVVLTRPSFAMNKLDGFFTNRLRNDPKKLSEKLSGYLYKQPITQLDISATAIRAMIAQGLSPQFLLPDEVLAYLYKDKLYQSKQ